MSFTLSHIIQGAKRAPEVLSSETAAYIVLSLTEQIMGAPREVTADSVLLHASGSLVVADVPHCSAPASDECLRELLATLLESVAASTVSDALRHVALGQAKGPVALRAELHAALVPLNRSAARRALVRLHRRLGVLFADSVLTLADNGAGLSRRGRRRGSIEALSSIGEEIHVTLDFNEAPAEVVLQRSPLKEDAPAFWHPAQTTPWQFNEAAHTRGEGTPIFGSLAVRERPTARIEQSPASHPEPILAEPWQPQRDEQTEAEAPVALRHQSERRASIVMPFVPEHDTQVDHPVADKLGVVVAPLRRVSSRRSRVSDLVQRFGNTKNEPAELAVAELYQMAAHSEGEFSALGTATPPPVARESLLAPAPPSKPKPRRILLKASLAVAPVIAFWLMQKPTMNVPPANHVLALEAPKCHATVRVSVPPQARVFLNDQQERPEQSGPIAVFQEVACNAQAEVTVRVPESSGSPLPDAWVRVPLPEADLTKAASQGRALEVAPLAP